MTIADPVRPTLFPERVYLRFVRLASYLQPAVLLFLRVTWGWQFFETGRAKLMDVPLFIDHFEKWGVPAPGINVYLAACTECFGGIFLYIGFGGRLISVPLLFTMFVAYCTAHIQDTKVIFSDPDRVLNDAPFPFLCAALVILAFGPGPLSIDGLLKWLFYRNSAQKSLLSDLP